MIKCLAYIFSFIGIIIGVYILNKYSEKNVKNEPLEVKNTCKYARNMAKIGIAISLFMLITTSLPHLFIYLK